MRRQVQNAKPARLSLQAVLASFGADVNLALRHAVQLGESLYLSFSLRQRIESLVPMDQPDTFGGFLLEFGVAHRQ